MSLLILAYLGGVLTILSPCILPVLPFVLSRAGQPFLRGKLPMLAGMALTFAAIATLASAGGAWAVQANAYGRLAALSLLALFGLSLLLPKVADTLARPLVALGNRLAGNAAAASASTQTASPSPWGSLLLGIATGMLWAPCAGPILGIVLTAAALQGASVSTSLALAAYAAGAATSLAAALGIGAHVLAAMKRSMGAGEWVRRGLGAGVLGSVLAIGLGADTGLLARLSASGPARIEQALVDVLHKARPAPQAAHAAAEPGTGMLLAANDMPVAMPSRLPVEGRMPALDGAVQWINSAPLTRDHLRGKVTLVYFWTYSCINCIRTLPYLRAWADKYKDQGLTVIGVHTPEFAFEKSPDNVQRAVANFRIGFPVAVDSDYRIWRAFRNSYWPAAYFVDAHGNIRHHQFGEGDYANSERVIQALLAEAGQPSTARDVVAPLAEGAQAAPDLSNLRSGETYLGYLQAANFASPGGMRQDAPQRYGVGKLRLNQWGLAGQWTVGAERATVDKADGSIAYRFHARDLHLVLGPAPDGRAVRFLVTIDGKPPGDSHGADIDAAGNGAVTQTRLYQLVRQAGKVGEHTFEIRFLDTGAQAYAFTFG
ncbi:cytochrome c biogenesis protein DipZ [Cupriavidus oxalaticus]|jgi:cytochrome c biogenesis protein CcdA/thiol-disulfide isomerase/thioredoxin|uniref:Cytochrome c biogenesis protein n=1 Tax=Cupriavidus oxalaticus TaxID=96344 RepID=A0A375FLD1_9BURK|nr:cytochrome c biogenesis protein DipZ [Cupriavidus oxalaticus]QRQ89035.1 cytochrome c biogenesis protein DipZ [Cupriavidus oxalaticus]QRQ95890.1 cytochrome c biogenesis protein DipZ [Cupriavidus oxalaticus]WQD84571.1 cytochrome c biogenesis protein DipZ [Cupriavidus oxalaticus]SPC06497.1 putative cytochrome c biogenesis protein [Cupriavidus oxalaticus]SPC12520.1 putative cytochrome c biogenesis protein [Cupriavidus oxalaticus]